MLAICKVQVERLERPVFDHKVLQALKLGHGAHDRTLMQELVEAAQIRRCRHEDFASEACTDRGQGQQGTRVEISHHDWEQVSVGEKPYQDGPILEILELVAVIDGRGR